MRIGVDLGGTKIAAVALDDAGTELASRRLATPGSYGAILERIAELIGALEGELGRPASVGIGTPGASCRKTGRMTLAGNTALEGRPFVADVGARLRREVRVTNDANCFALSEAVDGAAAGAELVVGVILGTGVGAGLVADGRVLAGARGLAGEWGHTPLPWQRADERGIRACHCGRASCIETFLAGPGISADHLRATERSLDAHEIVAAARAGDRGARATLGRFYDRLARSLAVLISLLDPDVIVLGGGVSKVHEIYDELPQRLPAWLGPTRPAARIVPSTHGDASGVRGAAWLWPTAEAAWGLPRPGHSVLGHTTDSLRRRQ
nr:ROK family protein [Plesiocystis pacifica]